MSQSQLYLPMIPSNAAGNVVADGRRTQPESRQIQAAAITSGSIDVRVAHSWGDAEESASGSVARGSGDLELIDDAGDNQTVGIRFDALAIPQGATIVNAYIQFQVDERSTAVASLTIEGEAADNAPFFNTASNDISSRPRTAVAVPWSPAPWTTVGEAGVDQQTPNLAAVIQEIVNRPGWSSGNALVTIITGIGVRTAEAYDGNQASAPLLHVEFSTAPPATVEVRVAAGTDDGEESASGIVSLGSSDLELVFDGGSDQTVGMRFNGLSIPQGATISNAYVQFQVDTPNSGATSLTIEGEAIDNAPPFTFIPGNLSSRARTTAAQTWPPVDWTTVDEAGPDQRTPDLAEVIQEIVNRPGWSSGNSLVILITGTGERTAEAFDGDPTGAPLLHVELIGN